MVARFSLVKQTTPPPVPFAAIAVDASWHVTAPTLLRTYLLGTGATDRSDTNLDITATDAVVTNPLNLVAVQAVTPRLQAQTISGNISIAISTYTSNVASGSAPRAVVRLFDSAGAYKSTLFAGSISSSVASTAARMNSALAVALTDTACAAGDRMVIEIGHGHANAVATSYTSTVRIGPTDGSSSQIAFVQGGGGALPWVEFSADLLFETQGRLSAPVVEVLADVTPPDVRQSSFFMEALGVQTPVEAVISSFFMETLGVQKPVEAAITNLFAEVLGVAGEPPPAGPPGIPNVPGTGRLYVQHEGVWYPLPAIAGVVT